MKVLDRKSEILNVATNLITEKGYNAVSMRDIARGMDMKAASLYNHISGKQDILSISILKVAELFTQGMNAVLELEATSTEKLTLLIHLHIDISVNHSGAMAMMNNDWMHLESESLSQFLSMRNAYENNFRNIIKRGISKNELTDKNIEVILFSMLSTLQTMYLWYEKRGKMDVNLLKKEMVDVLLNGITKG